MATGTTTQQQPVRYIPLDRNQLQFRTFDLEELIPQDHPARVIWQLCGSFNLQRFEEQCKSREGSAGRPCWPPQLLVSVWIYSYSLGVASARAIERMMGGVGSALAGRRREGELSHAIGFPGRK